ncbi:hypothetical protein QF023_000317 [Chryseobacterium sp. SLBN-27]|nr:hypothetical protein [Chryseobacterium sp. SLBN-27]
MKAKTFIIIFVISFVITNILVLLDYETVSLLETYRNSESLFEVLFISFFLFIVISIVTYLIMKLRKIFFNAKK